MKNIPLEEIIKLRNKVSFQKKLSAFHLALNDLTNTTGKKLTESNCQSINEHLTVSVRDLTSEVTAYVTGTIGMTMGLWLAISNNEGTIELAREFLDFYTVAGIGGIQVYNQIQSNRDRRLAARYLTDIKRLGQNY